MRIRLLSSLLVLLAASAVTPAVAETCEMTSYGAGVTLTAPTAIAAILDQPAAFTGKEVRIQGQVHEVCAMAGCWMEIQAADGDRVLKVKVKDGDIVFPVAARGKQAVAQGKVEDLEMSRSKYIQFREHAAKEMGEKFDAASLQGDGPFHVYQLAGTGAEICK
ncbi:MAG: DUF4920 domain-containing protein [Thermoanaerobaculia bacterium]